MIENKGKHLAHGRFALRTSVVAVVMALGGMNAVQAMEFDTGNPDVEVRWDNTVRYNIGVRANSRGRIANNPTFDEGEYKFDNGDVVTNRVDLISELDVVYKKKYGFRVSGAGWYDNAYRDTDAKRNPKIVQARGFPNGHLAAPGNLPVPGSYVNDKYSDWTEKYYHQGGELLDAFVFGTFDVGDMPLSLKYGRHTLFWGETLLLGGALHGVSYAQSPLDLAKGFATPGLEAKELFRPLESISGKIQVNNELSLAAQYFLDWEAFRLPEGGTYLGPVDPVFNGPEQVFGGALGLWPQRKVQKPDERGDIALSARWAPEALDATLGFYYRNYTDKLLSVVATGGAAITATNPTGIQYGQYYGEDIDLFGISLSKSIAGVSVGAEFSYRHNTPLGAPLLAQTPSSVAAISGFGQRLSAAGAALIATGVPANVIRGTALATAGGGAQLQASLLNQNLFPRGTAAVTLNDNTYQARGDTMHLVLNAVGVMPATALFDTASYVIEGTYVRLDDVTKNKDMAQVEGYGVCNKALKYYTHANPAAQAFVRSQYRDSGDGCATENFFSLAINFTPTWFQVLPGIDLSAPLSWSRGMSGNAPTAFGGNEANGSWSMGIAADAYQKYRFDLKYIDYIGDTKNGQIGGLPATTSVNGFSTALKDRGYVVATFKTTF